MWQLNHLPFSWKHFETHWSFFKTIHNSSYENIVLEVWFSRYYGFNHDNHNCCFWKLLKIERWRQDWGHNIWSSIKTVKLHLHDGKWWLTSPHSSQCECRWKNSLWETSVSRRAPQMGTACNCSLTKAQLFTIISSPSVIVPQLKPRLCSTLLEFVGSWFNKTWNQANIKPEGLIQKF